MEKKDTYLYVLLLPHMDKEYNLSYKVKFGYTENFKQRMKTGYEAYYGEEGYQVLHVYKGNFTKKDEDVIKQYLKKYSLFGNEWFKCCPEVLEFFATYNTTKKIKDKISTIPYIQPHRKYYKVNYHLVELIIFKAFPNLTELLDIQSKRSEISKVLRDYTEKNQINYVCDTYRITKEEIDKYLSSKQINVTEKACELAEKFIGLGDTTEKLKMLVDLENMEGVTEADINSFLELIPPKFKEYYVIMGPKFIYAFSCKEADIKREWAKLKSNEGIKDQVSIEVYKTFEVGKRYTKADIKNILGGLYKRLGYQKTAKASDLEQYFEVKKIYTSDKKNGFEILGKR